MAGKSVDEAKERALDQLGVAEADAEVIVLSEPKTGLFGRTRGEARVRARVRPVGARPRRERSRNSGRGQGSGQGRGRNGNGNGRSSAGRNQGSSTTSGSGNEAQGTATATARSTAGANEGDAGSSGSGGGTSRSARRRRNRRRTPQTGTGGASGAHTAARVADGTEDQGDRSGAPEKTAQRNKEPKETVEMAEGMTLEEQGEIGRAFVEGLLAEFGMQGSVACRVIDEETVEIAATGEDLGMLVGPRGSTLSAVQDLTRAVVQRQCPSRTDRILVDVAGYRERRTAALRRFSEQIAQEVLASGQERALEAMSPADRKSVHDAVNEIDGVVTRSEGEEPNRYIVIAPAG